MSVLVDLLHLEMVRYLRKRQEEKGPVDPLRDPLDCCDMSANCSPQITKPPIETPEARLEAIGLRTGFLLAERLSQEVPLIDTELEMMKFLCKDFWSKAFGKQADNLRTNHQGVYLVQDNRFAALLPFAVGTQYLRETPIYLCYGCGLIRGALASFGLQVLVTPSVEVLPVARFHVTIKARPT